VTWSEITVSNTETMVAGDLEGQDFVLLSTEAIYRSQDAKSWTRTARKGAAVADLAIGTSGTWVGLDARDSHTLHRSVDHGVTWNTMKPMLVSTNPLRRMAFGFVSPNPGCNN